MDRIRTTLILGSFVFASSYTNAIAQVAQVQTGTQPIGYTLPLVIPSEYNPADIAEDEDAGLFEMEVLKGPGTVLVEFMSPDCPASKAAAPVIAQMVSEYGGKVNLVRINIHKNPLITARYNIRRVPTVILFNKGKTTEKLALFNAHKSSKLAEAINRQLY